MTSRNMREPFFCCWNIYFKVLQNIEFKKRHRREISDGKEYNFT